ncbi:MAG: hypothetical protein KAJ28_04810 [Flavobacteriaceae bacterium]|nr:hypothetical protein [Flavobacteriaceae bacterium]
MNTKKIHLRIVTFFLSILLIFQSCASYKGSYTLQEAFETNRKVQILTITNEKLEYQKIDTLNGQWVGQKLINNTDLVYDPISPQTIRNIQVMRSKQDEKKEGRVILIIIGGVVLTIIALVIGVNNTDLSN